MSTRSGAMNVLIRWWQMMKHLCVVRALLARVLGIRSRSDGRFNGGRLRLRSEWYKDCVVFRKQNAYWFCYDEHNSMYITYTNIGIYIIIR